MKLRGLIDEDFTNYKKPSMFIICPYCTLKCDIENGTQICQNSSLLKEPIIDVDISYLTGRFIHNSITQAIVFGGLEPIDTIQDILDFLYVLRYKDKLDVDVVIYTGYTEEEIQTEIEKLKLYNNIIVKFGRYVPNQKPHFDEILGVELASDNQYAKKIS